MVFIYTKNCNGEFTCNHCEFTAKNQSTMHYHLAGHDGVLPHACKHCSKRFPQKGVLDIHMKLQHPETLETKETFKCPCKGCTYEDVRKGNRLIHFIRIHLKETVEKLKTKCKEEGMVLTCESCKKSFKNTTGFYYHAHQCVKPTANHQWYSEWITLKV